MERKPLTEILDGPGLPDEVIQKAYRDIARIHHWLGDTDYVVRAIRRDPLPARSIMDIGCATGLVLEDVQRRLGVKGVGVEINPHQLIAAPVTIVKADARRDYLPKADVAYCMCLGHHLCETGLTDMIRNVGRSCRRFLIVDLVRHPLPLGLFRIAIAPLVSRINAEDGCRSIRRSYTPVELGRIVTRALAGTAGTYRHRVSPFYVRQVIDISYAPSTGRLVA